MAMLFVVLLLGFAIPLHSIPLTDIEVMFVVTMQHLLIISQFGAIQRHFLHEWRPKSTVTILIADL